MIASIIILFILGIILLFVAEVIKFEFIKAVFRFSGCTLIGLSVLFIVPAIIIYSTPLF